MLNIYIKNYAHLREEEQNIKPKYAFYKLLACFLCLFRSTSTPFQSVTKHPLYTQCTHMDMIAGHGSLKENKEESKKGYFLPLSLMIFPLVLWDAVTGSQRTHARRCP